MLQDTVCMDSLQSDVTAEGETFGPVVPLLKFDTEAEVLESLSPGQLPVGGYENSKVWQGEWPRDS